jgi:DNA replication protein DnaC
MKTDLDGTQQERLTELLTTFKLPFLAAQTLKRMTNDGHEKALPTLLELLEGEHEQRFGRRTERLLKVSGLAPEKTWANFDETKLSRKVIQGLRELTTGGFLERSENVLFYGLPGRGKTHAAHAIGRDLVTQGHSVLWTPTFRLVQELLAAKRDLCLPKALRRLDNFELLILDDIGYVQQSVDEIEVLFTLLSERYERRSILVTSNLAFSEWDRIFKNPMTTAAAIDRFVHHCILVDFNGKSIRAEQAAQRQVVESA